MFTAGLQQVIPVSKPMPISQEAARRDTTSSSVNSPGPQSPAPQSSSEARHSAGQTKPSDASHSSVIQTSEASAPEPALEPPTDGVADSETERRIACFLEDLKFVYSHLDTRELKDYIPILADVFTRRRQEKADRAKRFATELRATYLQIAPAYSDVFLAKLAQQFDAWRDQTTLRLREFVTSLPDDDPLRSPISLFGVMQHGRLETAHTYVLAWLLDPKKEHGFDVVLLRALLSHLSGTLVTDPILVEKVIAEKIIENGRLDVLVQGKFQSLEGDGPSWYLMIEAKIDANEGDDQLRKYDKWMSRHQHGKDVFRVFLTTDGHDPETSDEEWSKLSFQQLVCVFRRVYQDLRGRPGFHFLRHYLSGVLKDVCHWDLPIRDPEDCDDPYNFIDYLKTVQES